LKIKNWKLKILFTKTIKKHNQTSMQKDRQSFSAKVSYWLKVVSLGMILGLGLQFAQAWTAPIQVPPGGNVAGPLTTGGSQTKTGSLTTGGLSAPSLVDSDNVNRFVNPSATSSLWGLMIASLPNCDLKTDASGSVYCGTDAVGAGGGVTSVSTGAGLTGGPITTTGTVSLNTSGFGACGNATTGKVYWDGSRLVCGTDQSGGGGGGVTGFGTSNYIPRWTAGATLGDSAIYQHGNNIVVGSTNSLGYTFGVNGTVGVTSNITAAGKVYSAATVGTDSNLTLTTKGYVDSRVGGVTSGSIVAGCEITSLANTACGASATYSCWGGASGGVSTPTCPSGSTVKRMGAVYSDPSSCYGSAYTSFSHICIKN
jgi:hypothetical protein